MRVTFWVLSSFLLFACGEDSLITVTPTTPVGEPMEVVTSVQYLQRTGVDPTLLSLDIYHSDETPSTLRPVVFYVHGGAWAIGDKANQITDKVRLFRGENYIFVSTNYRLSPIAGGGADRVKFPDHNLDVAAAIRWVYDNITAYGGDPNKIALLGHSAGAHLVALTGTNPDFLEREGLSPTLLSGVAAIDTEGYDVAARIADGTEAYINAFGLNPDDHRRASPLYNLEPDRVAPNFFIAKRGSTRRLALADEFATALESIGVVVQQVDGSVYTHAGINAAIGQPEEAIVTPRLLAFLVSCFGE